MMPAREAVIKKNRRLSKGYYLLEVGAPKIGARSKPGQFYMVKVGGGSDPLLRRPFCLHRVVSPDSIRILYRVTGYGTGLMSRMVPGDPLDILGPLGKGFRVERGVRRALLVAGGVGVAPIMGLADYLVKRPEVTTACFVGGRTKEDVLGLREFKALGIKTSVSTEDGSVGHEGFITGPLEDYILRNSGGGTKGWAIYSCGPMPMLRGVAAIAGKHGIRNYASLEANMACGVGACMGCVVSALDREHGTEVYKKVCEDGPVFDVDDIVWEQTTGPGLRG